MNRPFYEAIFLFDMPYCFAYSLGKVNSCSRYLMSIQNPISNDVVDEFITHYKREVFYYDILAKECAGRCRKILEAAGIKAIVTHRAKDPRSLSEKILGRHHKKGYASVDEIRKDVKDMAGVRIALFFADNQDAVESLLDEHFEIDDIIDHESFHKTGTSSDYRGIHFILRIPKERRDSVLMNDDTIEVQVMSLLHNIWSEIQHDIEYKPRSVIVDEEIKNDLHKLQLYLRDGEEKIRGIYQGWLQRGTAQRGSLENTPLERLQIGSLIKGEAPAPLYWYSQDGRRYVFPTERTLETWFPNALPEIVQVENKELQGLVIGGNVTYRPGVRLLRLATDPKIYAVERGGFLRWMKSEQVIEALYGKDWQSLVDVIPDHFFVNYFIGPDIESVSDHNPQEQRESVSEIDIGFVQSRHPHIFPGNLISPIKFEYE